MAHRLSAILAALAFVLGGCATAPQTAVKLHPDHVTAKATRIGVAMTVIPPADTQLPGASCLLCMAAANIANSALIDHSRTLPPEDLAQIKEEIAKRIRAKGATAVVIPEAIDLEKLAKFDTEAPNTARKNFAPLRERYGIDKLVVVEINVLGMWRTYSAYFPTSDPKATLQGRGYMVNLSNNSYDWYHPVMLMKASDKAWDEPPKFPGLTNAYFQVIELGKDEFLKAFD